MNITLTLTDYPLRGYERTLARLEAQGLGLRLPRSRRNELITSTMSVRPEVLRRLAFFKEVETSGRRVPTVQRYLDQSASLLRLSSTTLSAHATDDVPTLKNGHRALVHTYLTHGLHAYKGKFYPQLVRALVNYAGVSSGVVLDPFCGSGTAMLEAFLIGLRGIGVDLNPLAAFIARTKAAVLLSEPKEMEIALGGLQRLVLAKPSPRRAKQYDLPNEEYLSAWFDLATLQRLRYARWCIDEAIPAGPVRDMCLVVLSNQIRDSSLQRPGQLRIYRRANPPDTHDLLQRFVAQVRRTATATYIYHRLKSVVPLGETAPAILVGDARDLAGANDVALKGSRRVDIVVTSPPYATALPYLDTDRLSLAFLNLMTPEQRRRTDAEMIGNREISERRRKLLEDELREDIQLPPVVRRLLTRVLEGNSRASVGFRRRNAAALLYKYFADMRTAILEMHRVLKDGALVAIIIGNSRTLVGGTDDVEIPTDKFLLDIAESVGFERDQWIPMTDQPRYMIHTKNGIRSETIFTARKR